MTLTVLIWAIALVPVIGILALWLPEKRRKKLEAEHSWTWVGHSFAAGQLFPLLAVAVCQQIYDLSATGILAVYAGAVAGMAAYYIGVREQLDAAKYREKGTFDKKQADLTARVDQIGDAFGPFVAVVTVWTALLLHHFPHWWVPLAILATTSAFFFIATLRVANKPGRGGE